MIVARVGHVFTTLFIKKYDLISSEKVTIFLTQQDDITFVLEWIVSLMYLWVIHKLQYTSSSA